MDEKRTQQSAYEIASAGAGGLPLTRAFPDLRAQAHGTETVLTGPLLTRRHCTGCWPSSKLGLELLEVRRAGWLSRPS